MGKLGLLLAFVCFNTHALTLNFGRTENAKVTQKRLDKLMVEFKEITDMCCSLYKRNCNMKISYSYSDYPIAVNDKTTNEVFEMLNASIPGYGVKVLLGAYKGFILGQSKPGKGVVLFKKGDGVVLAHELGHHMGRGHIGNPANLMAPGDVMDLYPKPDANWCYLVSRY